jgi:hypothetical protein
MSHSYFKWHTAKTKRVGLKVFQYFHSCMCPELLNGPPLNGLINAQFILPSMLQNLKVECLGKCLISKLTFLMDNDLLYTWGYPKVRGICP